MRLVLRDAAGLSLKIEDPVGGIEGNSRRYEDFKARIERDERIPNRYQTVSM